MTTIQYFSLGFKKLKLILLSSLALMLTACATPPQFVSNYFNAQDPCQSSRPPGFCGAGLYSQSQATKSMPARPIYNSNGHIVGYTR
jgi:starvation-inducible outer membrane lipoprotein